MYIIWHLGNIDQKWLRFGFQHCVFLYSRNISSKRFSRWTKIVGFLSNKKNSSFFWFLKKWTMFGHQKVRGEATTFFCRQPSPNWLVPLFRHTEIWLKWTRICRVSIPHRGTLADLFHGVRKRSRLDALPIQILQICLASTTKPTFSEIWIINEEIC